MNKTNNNVNTALAIVLIALAIMLVGGLGATTTGLTSLQKAFAESQRPDRFAGQDRCVSSIDESGSSSTCFYGAEDRKVVNDAAKEAMEECKEQKEQGLLEKCSGSQTIFGQFCNWVKIDKDSVTYPCFD